MPRIKLEDVMADVKKRASRVDNTLKSMSPFLKGMERAVEAEESALRYRGMQLEAIRRQFSEMHESIQSDIAYIMSVIHGEDKHSRRDIELWIANASKFLEMIPESMQADESVIVLELQAPDRIILMKLLESPICKSMRLPQKSGEKTPQLTADQASETSEQLTSEVKPKTSKGTAIPRAIKHVSQLSNMNSNSSKTSGK